MFKDNVLYAATAIHTQINPSPEEPPGMGGLMTVVNWVAWGVVLACFLGALVAIGFIGVAVFNGRSNTEGFKGLLLSLVAIVLVGGLGGIIGAVA